MEHKLIDAASRLPEPALSFDGISPAGKAAGRPWRKIIALAASIALLLCLGFGGYAIAAEAKEYRAALAFFEKHDLSTQGLSRYEIKAIYLDITTKTFSYSKTAQVIMDSITTNSVNGNELAFNSPSPQDIESLWNYKANFKQWGTTLGADQPGIYYDNSSQHMNTPNGMEFLHSNVNKYENDVLVWSVPIPDFWVSDCVAVTGGVIAYGANSALTNGKDDCPWMAFLDANGNLIWKTPLTAGQGLERICAVVENNDGSYAVFTKVITKGNTDLYLYQISKIGTIQEKHLLNIKNKGIGNAVRFQDGYLLQLFRYDQPDQVVKVDRTGRVTDGYLYESQEHDYYISDMIEFGGEIYLSAYAVPQTDTIGGRREIDRIVAYAHEQDLPERADLTGITRENFTAILLKCDAVSGLPQEFFSVRGALGGNLEVNDTGELLWDVESITDAYWSPATSSFSVGGTCCIFRYGFGPEGGLTRMEQTYEMISFRR